MIDQADMKRTKRQLIEALDSERDRADDLDARLFEAQRECYERHERHLADTRLIAREDLRLRATEAECTFWQLKAEELAMRIAELATDVKPPRDRSVPGSR